MKEIGERGEKRKVCSSEQFSCMLLESTIAILGTTGQLPMAILRL